MNNRLTLGLAVGAGYVLGRTKKAKLAFAVGTMVMGKRLQLHPRALAEALTARLRDNPQFKEIGDQLRTDLRGVGKAATGAVVNRQISGLADRLHERTLGVQDQLSVALDEATGPIRADGTEDADERVDAHDAEDAEPVPDDADAEESPAAGKKQPVRKKAAARKPARTRGAAKEPAARKSADAKKAVPARVTARGKAQGSAAARKTAASRGGRSHD
ncbi:DNA primase [Streptomyces sp. NPDC006208]|uniref:DNA primase n=1 Tax=Streptomyces sp. NPDC006208 TaxID=3156734 RepID=UPI0033A3F664